MKRTLLFAVTVFALTVAAPVHADAAVLVDATDATADGGGCGAPENPCNTVQAGVNNAVDGDTIDVAAGTYAEQVIVTKAVTIDGAGNATKIKPALSTPMTLFTRSVGGPVNSQAVVVTNGTAGPVNIRELEIDGSAKTSQSGLGMYGGILYRGASGVIEDVDVHGFFANVNTQIGVGIYISSLGGTADVEVSNVDLYGYGKTGLAANFAGTDVDIHDSTATGAGPLPSGRPAQNGFQIGTGATGSMRNNQSSGHYYTPATFCASGFLAVNSGNVTIEDNASTGDMCAINGEETAGGTPNRTITGNTITGSLYGLTIVNGDATITGNDISVSGAGSSGIFAYEYNGSASPVVDVTGNNVTGADEGIVSYDYSPANAYTASMITRGNRIVGNVVGAAAYAPATMIAENNWWGCNAGPGDAACDSATGVDADPWLTLRTSATLSSVQPTESSVVTADVTKNSDDEVVVGNFFDASLDFASTGDGGDIEPSGTVDLGSGKASTVFTADNDAPGSEDISAELDAETETTTVTVNESTEDGTSEIAEPGDTVSTGPADEDDTTGASVQTPEGGVVTIVETEDDGGYSPAEGYGFLDKHVSIEADPSDDPADPLVLTFELYQPDLAADQVDVYRNGVLVEACNAEPPSAIDPNPCRFERSKDGDIITIGVYTTHASHWSFGVDETPPVIDTFSATPSGTIVQTDSIVFDWTASDEVPEDSELTYTCSLDGEAVPCEEETQQAYSGLSSGAHTFELTVEDQAHNTDVEGHEWFVDLSAPEISISGPGPYTNSAAGTFTFSATDPDTGAPTPSVQCRYDDADFGPCTTATTHTFNNIPAGQHRFEVEATDHAGRETVEGKDFFVDRSSPNATYTNDTRTYFDTGDLTLSWTRTDNDPSSGFQADRCRLVRVSPSPATLHGFRSCDDSGPDDDNSESYTGLIDGQYTFTLMVTDNSTRATQIPRTFHVDTDTPTFTISGVEGPTMNASPEFDFTIDDSPASPGGLTAKCTLTGPSGHAEQDCTSGTSQDYTDLDDGAYELSVTISDAAGNDSTETREFHVDTADPSVENLTGPAGHSTHFDIHYTDDVSPEFAWEVNDGAASSGIQTVECRLTSSSLDTDWQPCDTNTSQGYADLDDGKYTFRVRVTDNVTRIGFGLYEFFIDITDPIIDTVSPNEPHGNTDVDQDLGHRSSDSITFFFAANDPPKSGGFFAPQCTLDGPSGHAEQDCEAHNTQSYTGLADGSYTFKVRVQDWAGNWSTQHTRSFLVDTENPDVAITLDPEEPDGDSDDWYKNKPEVTVTVEDENLDELSVACEVNGETVNLLDTDNDPNKFVSLVSLADAADGANTTVECSAEDLADNPGTDSRTFKLDTTDPTIDVTSAPEALTNGDPDPEFVFTTDDNASGVATVECVLKKGETVIETDEDCDSPKTYDNDSLGADGDYEWTITVTDFAGNSASESHTFALDNVNPDVNVIPPRPQTNSGPTGTIHVEYSDPGFYTSGIDVVECKLVKTGNVDPGFQPCDFDTSSTNGGLTTASIDYQGLTSGEWTFTIHVTDEAGNEDTDSHTWFIDVTPPTVEITDQPAAETNQTSATFKYKAADEEPSAGGFTFKCKLDAGAWTACGNAAEGVEVTKNYTVTEGEHTFQVTSTDNAGNESDPDSYTWIVDTTPPVITLTFPENGARYSKDSTKPHKANYSCVDPVSNGVSTGVATCAGPVPNGADFDRSSLGTKTFTVNATDNVTNAAAPKTHTYEVSTFEQIIKDDDPDGYYRLGETEGNTLVDSSGNGVNGEYKNAQASGPEGISGDDDFARAFFGEDGYGYINGLTASSSYTLGGFFKFDDLDDQVLLHKGSSGAIWIEGGKIHFRAVDWNANTEVVDNTTVLNTNDWFFILGRVGQGKIRIYVNGVKTAERSGMGPTDSSSSTFYIGYGTGPLPVGGSAFHGSIDEVAIFPKAVSETHIKEIYLADPPPKNSRKPGEQPVVDTPDTAAPDDSDEKPGNGGREPAGNDEPEQEPADGEEPTDETIDETIDETVEDETVEDTATPASPEGTWLRADKSVIEITAKGKGWIGKVVQATARKAKARKAKAAQSCGLKKGVKALKLKSRKKGGYAGEIRDAIKKKGKCKTRTVPFTATLSEDGNTLSLTKKVGGKKKVKEDLERSAG